MLPYFGGQSISTSFLPILGSVDDDLIAALVATLAIAALLLWLTPPALSSAEVEVIEPWRIGEVLQEAHVQTSEWWYRGHSGRHFRSVTLPQLATDARNENVTKTVFILLLKSNAIGDT